MGWVVGAGGGRWAVQMVATLRGQSCEAHPELLGGGDTYVADIAAWRRNVWPYVACDASETLCAVGTWCVDWIGGCEKVAKAHSFSPRLHRIVTM